MGNSPITACTRKPKKAKKDSQTAQRNKETLPIDQNCNETQPEQETAASSQTVPTETTPTDLHEQKHETVANGDQTHVDSVPDDQVPRRVHTAEHVIPAQLLVSTRAASVRASRLLPPGEIYFIDEAEEDGVAQPTLASNN